MQKKSDSGPSVGKAIGIATLIMAASNLLSRLLGFVRVQVLAYYGGTGSDIDAYVFAFTLPDLINHFLAGSALSITFIPLFQKFFANNDERGAWRFFGNIFYSGTILFVLFIAAGYLFTPDLLRLTGGNISHNPETFALAVELTRIILPAQMFFFWGALLNGIQYAKKQFLFPALTPVIYNIGIIACGALLYPSIGIRGFSWGVVLGAFVGNVLVQIPGVVKIGARLPFVIDLRDSVLHRYTLLTLPFVFGMGLTFSNEFLFRIFSTFIPNGIGALAALDYSYRLMFILVGVFGQSVSAGIYPYLSQLAVEKRFDEMAKLVGDVLAKTAVALIPVSAVLMALSVDVVTVLFQRGSFTAASTALTSSALFWYLPGAFLCSAVLIVNRIYYAMQDTVFPLAVSTVAVILCLPLYWLGAKNIGVAGVAGAASICMGIQFIVQYSALEKRGRGAGSVTMVRSLFFITLLSAAGALGVAALHPLVASFADARVSSDFLKNTVVTGVLGIPALAIILSAIHLFGIHDVVALVPARLRKRFSFR